MSPLEALGVAVLILALAAPLIIVGVVYYLKKRFEHKQIMTAIEKGTPLSELKPPKQNGALWIKNITVGIALLIIGLALVLVGPWTIGSPGSFIIAFILCGVGIAWMIRGLLYRKYQVQSQPLAKSNAVESQNPLGISTPETLQPTNE